MTNTILYTLAIAFVNSIDNLGAWIAFDLKGIRVNNKMALWISAITFVISAASALFGNSLRGVLDKTVCAWISAAVFVGMGAWFIAEPLVKRRRRGRGSVLVSVLEHPEQADLNGSKDIDFKEAALLGVALSLNNAGGSFSAGVVGLDPWAMGALCAVFSFGFVWVGRLIARLLGRAGLADKATLASGALLIAIGLKQLF